MKEEVNHLADRYVIVVGDDRAIVLHDTPYPERHKGNRTVALISQ